jgi:hypothetical protein
MGRALLVLVLLIGGRVSFAQTNAEAVAAGIAPNDPGAEARARVPGLYQAWKAEHDPAKRNELAGAVVDAVIHEYENQQTNIADEIARDGRASRLIMPPAARGVALTTLVTLDGVHTNEMAWPGSPIFRRIADNRFEAWTSKEGWLFDSRGRLITHVKVPRRDGAGREWFGAFLPDGTWITTDLWQEDKQINAFDAKGKWLWEVDGEKVQAAAPTASSGKPIIGWARADKLGRGWLVSAGTEDNTDFALVSESGAVAALPAGQSIWSLVQPRAMGVRGFYISLSIDSDDGKVAMHRVEAGHGVGVGWPTYTLSPGDWTRTIQGGNDRFGFWPKSHEKFIAKDGEEWSAAHRLWFFDEAGRYRGQIEGDLLGDAADGSGMLVKTPDEQVVTVARSRKGPTATQRRSFTWADGTRALPVAIYDDLRLGFFLRGAGIQGPTDEARRGRAGADIVLAKW